MGDPLILIIYIVLIALFLYVVIWGLSQFSLPQPIRAVIVVGIALILLLWMARVLGVV